MHAAGRSATELVHGARAVVLAARDEEHLAAIERRLSFDGVAHSAIREPDPPWNGALMAIGLRPTLDAPSSRLLRRLPLLGER